MNLNEFGNLTNLLPIEYQSGLKSYFVQVSQSFVRKCHEYDQIWDNDFGGNVGFDYPYTMSPKTSELIASASIGLKVQMSNAGFHIDPWKIGSNEETYVFGVLRRIMVPDTIEPIIGYTDEIVKHLIKIKEKDAHKVVSIRSFFCGAAVADKCLIARLFKKGIYGNLIATDIAADSIAIAVLNFTIWNESLPENEKYEIHVVKGAIPRDFYFRDKTIVLQVENALTASKDETNLPVKFDALLLDNGLQYVSKEFTETLLKNVLVNIGEHGVYIGALGLDSDIKVEISALYHLSQIFISRIRNLRKAYKRKAIFEAPYDYPHKYHFSIEKDSNVILIKRVISDGAAKMYTWLGKLLFSNRAMFFEVMGAIKSATELSKANKVVKTTPFNYHNVMVDTINIAGFKAKVLEIPLDYEIFGWRKVGNDLYEKGELKLDGDSMMRNCKEKDPLVLRRSRIKIEIVK